MNRLWYLRREDRVSGPFPVAAVRQDLLLGRLRASDVASPDREQWAPLSSFDEFRLPPAEPEPADPAWREERARARMRWADQRREAGRPGWLRRALGSTATGPRLPWRLTVLALLAASLALVLVAEHVGVVQPVPVHLLRH